MLGGFVRRHPYGLLFGLALSVHLAVARLYHEPGYTDAFYYCNVARSLWEGGGFHEDYVWNFLGRPIPSSLLGNPSCTYWMPLTAVLVELGYLVSGAHSFFAAQVPIVVASSLLAPLGYYIGVDLFGRSPGARYGWLIGLLTVFAGVYGPSFSVPDSFAPFALVSSLFFVATYKALRTRAWAARRWMVAAGVLAGLAYLTRADGLLLPVAAIVSALLVGSRDGLVSMLVAFAATVAPWLLRNLRETGRVVPAGSKVLFLREYNDFFSYDKPLDWAYFLGGGARSIVLPKLWALAANWQIVGRGTLVFMTPLFVLGLLAVVRPGSEPAFAPANVELGPRRTAALWRRPELVPVLVYGALLYLVMSLVFTFPGLHGSVFHAAAALSVFLFVFVAVGLDVLVVLLGRRSQPGKGRERLAVYSVAVVAGAAAVTAFSAFEARLTWDRDYDDLVQLTDWLDGHGEGNAVVMVPDAPAFVYVARRPAVVVANDPLSVNVEIARKYGATYFFYQPRHAAETAAALAGPDGVAGFTRVARFGESALFRLQTPHGSGEASPLPE